MPTYGYNCTACGDTLDLVRPMVDSDKPTPLGCQCGGDYLRSYAIAGVRYPGGQERFHNTTYKRIWEQQNNSPEMRSGETTRADSVRHV